MVDKDKNNNEIDPFDDDSEDEIPPSSTPPSKGKPEDNAQKDFDEQFESEEIKDSPEKEEDQEEEVDSSTAPEVSASPKKNFIILIAGVSVALVIMMSLIFGGDDSGTQKQNARTGGGSSAPVGISSGGSLPEPPAPPPKIDVSKNPPPVSLDPEQTLPQNNTGGLTPPNQPPPLPSPEGGGITVAPAAPETPEEPAAPELPEPPISEPEAPADDRLAERMKSPMLVLNGTNKEEKKEEKTEEERQEEAELVRKVRPRKVADITKLIAQGKIIDAVLETAINTDLPGVIRAVVSRDIYSEAGKNILIPKGSRLIGSYNADVKRGQARVYAVWSRVIMPNGTDLIIQSPGTDQLGRTGFKGDVDNRYTEILGNSILFSALNFMVASVAESLTGSQGVQQTQNPNGTTTTSGSPSDFALQDSIQSIGATIKGVTGDLVNVRPTVTIDQGTKIKVFVNRDLVFEKRKEDEKSSETSNNFGGLIQ